MSKHEISMNARVRVHVGPAGKHILREYLDPSAPRHSNGGGKLGQIIDGEIYMPLWEMLKIFGPHIVSSVNAEMVAEAITVTLVTDEARLQDLTTMLASKLRAVLWKVVGTSISYQAPEALGQIADEWVFDIIDARPTEPGFWWHGDSVLRVVKTETGPGVDGLAVVANNGRRIPVENFAPSEWGGPARRDPRVVPIDDEESEDIPF